MTDFPIGLRNGLISAEHRRRMGIAVWEFMWLVDHVTEEYQLSDGETRGRVLGGTMIEAERIAGELGMSPDAVRDNLKRLDLAGYIVRRRAPNGLRIEVCNSKKWVRPPAQPPAAPERTGEQENGRIGESSNSPTLQLSNSPVALDIAVDTDNAESQSPIPNQEGSGAAAEWWNQAITAAEAELTTGAAKALRQCQPIAVDQNAITVAMPAGVEWIARGRVTTAKVSARLEAIAGRPLQIQFIQARAGPT
jgi:hypothetical protein